MAYSNVPFPIEYIASCIKKIDTFKLSFPLRNNYSLEFKDFLKNILVLDPDKRGGIG